MDKRGARILLGCTLCTLIVLALLMVAFRFTQPSCELVFIEPSQLRAAALAAGLKEKPVRAHDKSMLIKINAHLEYNLPTSSSSPSLQTANSTPPPPASPTTTTSTPTTGLPAAAGLHQSQPGSTIGGGPPLAAGHQPPSPSVPQIGFTNQQLQNNSYWSSTSPVSSLNLAASAPATSERFLPLELEDLESKRVDEMRTKYTLRFNCSTITMVFVNRPERVSVEQISVELKLASRGKTTCELHLKDQGGAFAVEARDGALAHYYCDRPLKFSCLHYSSKQANKPAILLADLHIHRIEFETGSGNSSQPVQKLKKDFQSQRSECVRAF